MCTEKTSKSKLHMFPWGELFQGQISRTHSGVDDHCVDLGDLQTGSEDRNRDVRASSQQDGQTGNEQRAASLTCSWAFLSTQV